MALSLVNAVTPIFTLENIAFDVLLYPGLRLREDVSNGLGVGPSCDAARHNVHF